MDKKDFMEEQRCSDYCEAINYLKHIMNTPRIEIDKLYLFMERNRSFISDMMSRDSVEWVYLWEVLIAIENNISDEFIKYVYYKSMNHNIIMMKALYALLCRGYISTKEEIDECLKINSDYHLFEIIVCCGQDRGKDHFINIKNDYLENGVCRIKEFKWSYNKGNIEAEAIRNY